MKVVILAGGIGSRLSEETDLKPKPMVEIGGKPILWHIMKLFSHYGFNDFIICLGYRGYLIKEYFHNYFIHSSNLFIDVKKNKFTPINSKPEPWKITLIDTGLDTMTGGRIKRIEKYIDNSTFMLTYGDGISDINLKKLLQFHKKNSQFATVTAIQPYEKYGALNLDNNSTVLSFREKPKNDELWINGGFFILEPGIFKYIKGDTSVWEKEPLEKLASQKKLKAYKHSGFWRCMDTYRDKLELEKLWQSGKPAWKIWK